MLANLDVLGEVHQGRDVISKLLICSRYTKNVSNTRILASWRGLLETLKMFYFMDGLTVTKNFL